MFKEMVPGPTAASVQNSADCLAEEQRVERLLRYDQNGALADELDRLMADIQARDDRHPGPTPRR